jgi:4-amino-4-deoxy-L-arabinose transferase-like glycosyltransferase
VKQRSHRSIVGVPAPLLVAVMLVLGLGYYFALYLVPSEDEAGYLVLGAMATRGEISLYQDEIAAGRLPLPFYVLGISQLVVGPSLLSARLWSLMLGAASVGLIFIIAEPLWGRLTATLATLFVATHAMIIGNFASSTYDGLCSLVLAAGLYALLVLRAPLVAMAIFSTFSLTRPNMAVIVPLVFAVLWWQARSRSERWWLLLLTAGPPLLFFAADISHLKILMHVPGLGPVMSRFGFVSFVGLGAETLFPDRSIWDGMIWFARRHLPWTVAAFGLAGAWLIGRLWAGRALWAGDPRIRFIALLTGWTLACQAIILHHYLKSVSAWVAGFTPLPALLLGYVAARFLESTMIPYPLRWAVVTGIAAIFLVGPTYSTHTAMPQPLPIKGTTLALLNRTVEDLRAHVPPGSRIFLFGNSLPSYLAGVHPYPQQLIHAWTLVQREDTVDTRRSGVWGRREIATWLNGEAPYALISESRVAQFTQAPGYRPVLELMEQQLVSHYRFLTTLEAPPFWAYRLYVRRSSHVPAATRN